MAHFPDIIERDKPQVTIFKDPRGLVTIIVELIRSIL